MTCVDMLVVACVEVHSGLVVVVDDVGLSLMCMPRPALVCPPCVRGGVAVRPQMSDDDDDDNKNDDDNNNAS